MLVVFSSNEVARGFNAHIYKVGVMLEAQTNV